MDWEAEESEPQWEKWEKENVPKLTVKPEALEKRIKEGKVKDMSEKQTTHNYDFRTFNLFGHMYFWGRTDSTTDVLDENERMLFNIPFVAEERDVRMALFGYLERDLRDFAKGAKK